MDQDNTILIKKESKIKSTSLVLDKMNQNDIVHNKKESKTYWRKTTMFTLLG